MSPTGGPAQGDHDERQLLRADRAADDEGEAVVSMKTLGSRAAIVFGAIIAIARFAHAQSPVYIPIDDPASQLVDALIDLHTHLADGASDDGDADPAGPLKRSEARTILMGARAARTELRSGFTTVRDVGVYRGLTDIALRDAINAGDVE